MNIRHKAIRAVLRELPKPTAAAILRDNLPEDEYSAIYFRDVEQKDLNFIADTVIHCSESAVKKKRQSGYRKLAALNFGEK